MPSQKTLGDAIQKTLDPRYSFTSRLGWSMGLVTFVFLVFLAWIVGNSSKSQIEKDSGDFVSQLAYQMSGDLYDGVYAYINTIRTLAADDVMHDSYQGLDHKGDLIENIHSTYKDLTRISLADASGKTVYSTDTSLVGQDMPEAEWLSEGTDRDVINKAGDSHLIAILKNEDSGEKYLDISTPVLDEGRHLTGTLAAHLSWQWAIDLRDNLIRPTAQHAAVEIFVLSSTGHLLLAPEGFPPYADDFRFDTLNSFQLALQGKNDSVVESWDDGTEYLTGFARIKNSSLSPSLGWIVLVRQPAAIAFLPAFRQQEKTLLWGALIGLACGMVTWLFAQRISKPLIAIANAAKRTYLGGERAVAIPTIEGRDEVAVLSSAISRMYESLNLKNGLLAEFNAELEGKVAKRTSELQSLNQQLQGEIHEKTLIGMELQRANEELLRLSLTDGLTGIANRRHFNEYLKQEWLRAAREHAEIAVVMMDVDFFKRYNDHYGHQAGDLCLQAVADILKQCVKRPADLVSRYGGEEFALILPGTGAQGALRLSELIIRELSARSIPHAASTVAPHVTLSLGIATARPSAAQDADALVRMADQALYEAKEKGRNRACVGA